MEEEKKAQTFSPLWIRPIATSRPRESVNNDTKTNSSDGAYQVLQQMITASPNPRLPDAEIETTLEAFVTPSGDCLWRRVAVWSGPCSPQRVIHASFILSTHGQADLPLPNSEDGVASASLFSSLVCWAAFPERPEHKLLCVLVNPSTLSIWDVYPDSDKVYVSAEGHSVSLPFHCCSIHPLGESHGLLLQRKEDQEDLEAHHQRGLMGMGGTPFHLQSSPLLDQDQQQQHPMDEGDDFFLKVPPPNTRIMVGDDIMGSNATQQQRQHAEDAGASGGVPLSTPRTQYGGPAEVSSLFSLKHPLEDVLPVSYSSNNNIDHNPSLGVSLVTDVFEKILYTSTLRWTDRADNYLEKQFYKQPVCVTYHTVLKRHAIWALKGAPDPAKTPPLWQRSRNWRANRDWDDHIGMLDQDLEDMEMLGVVDTAVNHDQGPTREDALADALGVRKTPRRVTDNTTRGAAHGGLESRTNNKNRAVEPPGSVNRSGFLHAASRSMKETSFFDSADVSMAADITQLLNLRPLSNLHPNIAVDCLFEEPSESGPASNVFLASNLEGSGLLIVGLVTPSTGDPGDSQNPNTLRLLSVEPTKVDHMNVADSPSGNLLGTISETLQHSFAVKLISSIPCVAAQPIQSTTVPTCFIPHRKHRNGNESQKATDMLVLSSTNHLARLSLQRSSLHIADGVIASGKDSDHEPVVDILDIKNAVGRNVDFTSRRRDTGVGIKKEIIRASLSLEMLSNALAEKALVAIESCIFNENPSESHSARMEFALKLRADCCRLEHSLCTAQHLDSAVATGADNEWVSVATLLDAVVDFEFFGASSMGITGANARKAGSNAAWASLMNSSFHANFQCDNGDTLFMGAGQNTNSSAETAKEGTQNDARRRLSSIGSAALACLTTRAEDSFVSSLFDTLHLVFEDLKLSSDSSKITQLRLIGSFLVKTCCKCMPAGDSSGLNAFLDHYKQDLGSSWVQGFQDVYSGKKVSSISVKKMTTFDLPPSVLSWLDSKIQNASSSSLYSTNDLSTINSACATTRSLLRIYCALFRLDKDTIEKDYAVVKILCEEGFLAADEVREELTTGVALPLLETLSRCRSDPEYANKAGWMSEEFALVGRQDMSVNKENTPVDIARRQSRSPVPVRTADPDNPTFADKDKDGIVPLQVSSALLFPADNRVKEAGRLLRSSRPCYLSVPRAVEVTDHEFERVKQNKLLLLCRRALASPVGRGMLTIGSFHPVAAEPLPVPDLCMAGRVPPANTNLALDMSECHSEFRVWPEFHNGVAAGLRLPLDSEIGDSISKITRTWIVYNRPNPNNDAQGQNQTNGQTPAPNNQSHAHGGLLLALGLRGHLAALEMTDIYDYLTQGQVTLTCGVLLGMAANKRGSCDISVSKMLCLHLPSLIPNHFSSIDVNSSVQQAAALGAGLLFQGSSHRMMTEFLLNEIGRRPESDITLDREAYTLSCGIALGMVNICKGDNIIDGQHTGGGEGLADLRIGERLYRYIAGGTDKEEHHRTREANDRLNIPAATSAGENERSSCVFEGDAINIDVTAAGATLALGLIFLRSGNRNIASAIALPDTHFLLEYVRPDFLSLRVIAKALILWEDVEPTKHWIEAQLPQVVRAAYWHMRQKMKRATNFGDSISEEEANIPPIGGDRMHSSHGQRKQVGSQTQAQDYDCQAVRQIYVHVIAGACFGMGLRYAGTANKQAAAAIFERVVELQTLRDANDSVSIAMRPELQILETCLGCCAISLAMVNAGTGDLEALKLFKILRWRCDEEVKYGTHMSYSMAIGLLFLGGGTCTLGREPEDIAALVAAFFPRFPFTTTDNQYHLQALRHVYALAVKRRDLRFVDVDTGETVPIPVEINFQDRSSGPIHLMAPCLLPNTDKPALEAKILSDQFYPLKFDLNQAVFGKTLFVKRKFDYSALNGLEPKRSLLTQSGNFEASTVYDVVKSLTRSPYVQAFARYICGRSPKGKSQYDATVENFSVAVLQECLAGYNDVSLPVYLKLRTSIASMEAISSSAPLLAWDFRLMRSYYELPAAKNHSDVRAMLNIEKVAYLSEMFTQALHEHVGEQTNV